jgi:hypothetical protein
LPPPRVDNNINTNIPAALLTGTIQRESVSLPPSLESSSFPRIFKEKP